MEGSETIMAKRFLFLTIFFFGGVLFSNAQNDYNISPRGYIPRKLDRSRRFQAQDIFAYSMAKTEQRNNSVRSSINILLQFVYDVLEDGVDDIYRNQLKDIEERLNALYKEISKTGATNDIINSVNRIIDNLFFYHKQFEQRVEEEYRKAELQNEKKTLPEKWTGTGFALSEKYIVTNCHVIDNAQAVFIYGIEGIFDKSYRAEIVCKDTQNDLAILKIVDENFKGFVKIPYTLKKKMADVGEDVFVLGYPLIGTMGGEIKLTTGIVSSRTGYMGEPSQYQISAPLQPGNSGGPLFDKSGNLIGIVNAKHSDAENVGYAIKTIYLSSLIESASIPLSAYNNNNISNMTLVDKVKQLKNYIFVIFCSSRTDLPSQDVEDITNPIQKAPPTTSQPEAKHEENNNLAIVGDCYTREGGLYKGEMLDGRPHGKGITTFPNGNTYEGDYMKGRRHGRGLMSYFTRDIYNGEWKYDKREGRGKYIFSSGAYYEGQWKDDKKNGRGVFDWADGTKYDGDWRNDLRQGRGTYTYANGDQYTGDWRNDLQNGRGIYKFANGDVYEGQYADGQRTGDGILKYANGDRYTGRFLNGEKSGTGTYSWSNGDTYTGQWKDDLEDGIGRLVKKNGDCYEGTFKAGHVDGEVIIHFADHSRFKGIYVEGRRNGPAIEEYTNGLRFEGSYVDDCRDGDFIEKYEGEIVIKGYYEDGIRYETYIKEE